MMGARNDAQHKARQMLTRNESLRVIQWAVDDAFLAAARGNPSPSPSQALSSFALITNSDDWASAEAMDTAAALYCDVFVAVAHHTYIEPDSVDYGDGAEASRFGYDDDESEQSTKGAQ